MVLIEDKPYEGVDVDPNLQGGGGAVIVLLEDEHLRLRNDEGPRVGREPPKEGGEVSS